MFVETKFYNSCVEKLQHFQLIAKRYNVLPHITVFIIIMCSVISEVKTIWTSLGGFEPPTFRLTAERANQLRHRDGCC